MCTIFRYFLTTLLSARVRSDCGSFKRFLSNHHQSSIVSHAIRRSTGVCHPIPLPVAQPIVNEITDMNEYPISHAIQTETTITILQLLLKISERHKREHDINQVRLLEKLIGVEQGNSPYNEFLNTWNKLTATLFSAPHWFSLLMDEIDNTLSERIHLFFNKKCLPDPSVQKDYIEWNKKTESN